MIEVKIKHQQGDFSLDAGFQSDGGVVALFGPSGAGKTTIIKAIAGLLSPDAGVIKVRGRVLFDRANSVDIPAYQRRVGYVFQEARLFPNMSVEANLRYGQKTPADIGETVALLGLQNLLNRAPKDLSGGEAQRVAIARALLSNPDILLMDEPLAALDAKRKADILPYLRQVCDYSNVPIFYVSHALSEVARLADHLVLLREGRVTRAGPLNEILADPDAVPDVGVRDAGALIEATLKHPDAGDGLSELQTSGGRLFLPKVDRLEGAQLRVRILARDVIIATSEPQNISALNVLPAKITTIRDGQGPGVAVGLLSGSDHLLARITRRSAKALGLQVGDQIFAVIKSVSVAPADVGLHVT